MLVRALAPLTIAILMAGLAPSNGALASKGKDLWTKARKAYGSFSYKRAAGLFEQMGRGAGPKATRARAYAYVGVCYYNLTDLKQADKAWRTALGLDLKVKLPPGQPPPMRAHFDRLRKAAAKAGGKPKSGKPGPKTAGAVTPKSEKPAKGAGRVAVALKPKTKVPPPGKRPSERSFFSRHKYSLILAAGAVVLVGTGGALVAVSNSEYGSYEQALKERQSHETVDGHLKTYQATGNASRVFFVGAGVAVLASLGVFVLERVRGESKPGKKTVSLQPPGLVVDPARGSWGVVLGGSF